MISRLKSNNVITAQVQVCTACWVSVEVWSWPAWASSWSSPRLSWWPTGSGPGETDGPSSATRDKSRPAWPSDRQNWSQWWQLLVMGRETWLSLRKVKLTFRPYHVTLSLCNNFFSSESPEPKTGDSLTNSNVVAGRELWPVIAATRQRTLWRGGN